MPPAPSTYSERQSVVVANVLAGIDYERYRLQQVMLGCAPMSKDTWYAHQTTVYDSIIAIAESWIVSRAPYSSSGKCSQTTLNWKT